MSIIREYCWMGLMPISLACALPFIPGSAFSCELATRESVVVRQPSFPALSWGEGDQFMVVTQDKNRRLFCVYRSKGETEKIRCLDEGQVHEGVYFHDIDWVGNRVYYAEGFDDGGLLGYMESSVVPGADMKRQYYSNDLFGFSVSYDAKDDRALFTQADGIGAVYSLKNGVLEVIDKNGFDVVPAGDAIWYSAYGRKNDGIAGILRLDRKTGKRTFATRGQDMSPSVTGKGQLFFIRDEGTWKGKVIYTITNGKLCKINIGPLEDIMRIKVNAAGDQILVVGLSNELYSVILVRVPREEPD